MNNNDQQFMAQKIRTQYMEKQSTELDALRAAETPTAKALHEIIEHIASITCLDGEKNAGTDFRTGVLFALFSCVSIPFSQQRALLIG